MMIPALRTTLSSLLLAMATLASTPAWSGPAAQALGTCVTDSTTGKERREMTRWMFIVIAAHPDMESLARTTSEERESASRQMADLVTSLVTERCLTQAQAALRSEGSASMRIAFAALGEAAMRDLVSNPEVDVATSDFTRYLDQARFRKLMEK